MNQQLTELDEFTNGLLQEAYNRIEQQEHGGITQNFLTEVFMEYLCDAGATANTIPCSYLKMNKRGHKQMKVDGFALDEGYETIDLFVSSYFLEGRAVRIPKAEITKAGNLIKKFLNGAIKGHLEDMEESADVFELTRLLWQKRHSFIRANLFILTDGICDLDPPEDEYIGDLRVKYHIWDINRFFRLHQSGSQREPILIDFEQDFEAPIPCLAMPGENQHYQTYLAIVPGHILAQLYEIYGARLLESNVRAFLQNTGKINKGIRNTIRNEPQMFLAFNNGISATAETVRITTSEKGVAISSIVDLQVVNGGQTTASIFHAKRKDKADVTEIYVQMKLTVVRNPDEATTIVPRIARYANSQNKVSEADLSSNHPFHIQLENLSRTIFAPAPDGSSKQTRWFYERVRGQYREEKNREATPTRKKAFDKMNPTSQKIAKTDVAKFIHTWQQLPHLVVRGAQKNYVEFIKGLKNNKPGKVFFEDLVAKAILFKSAEKVYGRGENALGDLNRYLVVPYALAWLNWQTKDYIDLERIWKNQRISVALEATIRDILIAVNRFLKEEAPGGLVSEWGKREDCWKALQGYPLGVNLHDLNEDLADPQVIRKRYEEISDDGDLSKEMIARAEAELRSFPYEIWRSIEKWGRGSSQLSPYLQSIANNVGKKVLRDKFITENERKQGLVILRKVRDQYPDLLQFEEDDIPSLKAEREEDNSPSGSITVEMLKALIKWEKQKKRLTNWDFKLLKEALAANAEVSPERHKRLLSLLKMAEKYGFQIDKQKKP